MLSVYLREQIEILAKKTDPRGMYLLGRMRFAGHFVPKDEKAGLTLLRAAAETGYVRAMEYLAKSLSDAKEAIKWAELAALKGSEPARLALGKSGARHPVSD